VNRAQGQGGAKRKKPAHGPGCLKPDGRFQAFGVPQLAGGQIALVYQGPNVDADFQGGGDKLSIGGFDDKGAEQERPNDYSTHCVHNK
jgi:hypothetical protein